MQVEARMRIMRGMGWFGLAVLLCTPQARAQLAVGNSLKMNLSGSLGYGYSASYGDASSGHGQNLIGSGTLTGSYYNPGFISFTARPYWDRNQNNGGSGSIAHDNGIDTSMNFFGGSSFPGGISYGKSFSNGSQFGVPGVGGIETHGSGQSFGANWSELLPGLPPVYVSFSSSDGSFSALGSDGKNHSSSRNFSTGTSYSILGFNLSANLNHGNSSFDYSDVLGWTSSGTSSSTSYSLAGQHRLPFRGGMGVSFGHSSYGSKTPVETSGSTNTFNANTSFAPWSRFSFSGQGQYTTNLMAAIGQELLPVGGILQLPSNGGSHSLGLGGGASFSIGHGWTTNATVNRTSVSFGGFDNVSTQFSGVVSYQVARSLFGLLHFSAGIVDLANKQGNAGAGMVGNVGMDHRFGRWDTSADFSYSQDVRTLYGIAVTSNYSYGGSLRRKLNSNTYWSGAGRSSHSGLSPQVGSSSAAQSMSTSLMWGRYMMSGGYSQSQGQSVLSSSGVLTPMAGASLITNDFLLFNGRSLSASGSTRLFRRINLAGAYSRSRSELVAPLGNTFAATQTYNVHVDYRLRKMSLIGGFSRIQQNASVVKSGPFMLNSFYLSFSRWFNVF